MEHHINKDMTTLGYLRLARDWLTPTRTQSAFLDKGVLTPDEFVRAGDELVFRCPTWSWEAGDPSRRKPYLPADKQFLITRHVPCPMRVATLEQSTHQPQFVSESVGGDDDDEGDWLVSNFIKAASIQQHQGSNQQGDDDDDGFDIVDESGEVVDTPKEVELPPPSSNQAPAQNLDDEYADMADFEDDNVIQDEDTAVQASTTKKSGNKDEDHVWRVRTYDLTITYDKYFQTPRLWMMGMSAAGQPLTGKEMMEDVMSDYANKTVTIEAHPHVSGPHASIHPCKHSKVMKTIVQNLVKASSSSSSNINQQDMMASAPSIEMYLFIFLKFVSSIIPTINYDFTMDVQANVQRQES